MVPTIRCRRQGHPTDGGIGSTPADDRSDTPTVTRTEAGLSSRGVSTIRPPSPELLHLADTLDDAIAKILDARSGLVGANKWEAPREAWAVSNLLVRNIEAVLLLARTAEVMVSAAWTNARCAFEQAVRIIWLLQPADRYTSEGRWLSPLCNTL
ncbi:hypothetical protein ACIOHH_35115 [Streptomyces microflavus]|uniref:hypothetical protein n=1 Tax=Streptomyces microflavus TaxID=1919 RepID=UPI00380D99EF